MILLIFFAFLLLSCGSTNRYLDEDIVKIDTIHVKDTFVISSDTVIRDTIYLNTDIYRNPIIKTSLPDPTVIKARNGFFTYMLLRTSGTLLFTSQIIWLTGSLLVLPLQKEQGPRLTKDIYGHLT